MNSVVKNIIRAGLFILVQVFVLDKIPPLSHLATPYLYFLFILWLPFNMNRSLLMVVAFFYGSSIDLFSHNPGFHAAACVLIAYIRPFLIKPLIPQEGADENYQEPSVKSMGGMLAYFVYILVLTLVHHFWLFFLQAWQFGNFWYFILKTLFATAISLLLILITELIFVRKQKFRTNTV